jgi:four helix bundle protein
VKSDDLRSRTKAFALAVIDLTEKLPRTRAAEVIGRQLLRSGTSVGANYRAAQRSQSRAAMIAKLSIVEEEADECCYWLELLVDSAIVPPAAVESLRREASSLTAIVVSSKKTLRGQVPAGRERPSTFDVRRSEAANE